LLTGTEALTKASWASMRPLAGFLSSSELSVSAISPTQLRTTCDDESSLQVPLTFALMANSEPQSSELEKLRNSCRLNCAGLCEVASCTANAIPTSGELASQGTTGANSVMVPLLLLLLFASFNSSVMLAEMKAALPLPTGGLTGSWTVATLGCCPSGMPSLLPSKEKGTPKALFTRMLKHAGCFCPAGARRHGRSWGGKQGSRK
jgi:hypothetical protein